MTDATRRWAVVLGGSAGVGAEIVRTVAQDPGLDVFAFHRGHHPESAAAVADAVQSAGGHVRFHAADAGRPDAIPACVDALAAVVPPRSVRLFVHSISGASLGHFLDGRGDAFHPKQFEKTFNYLAHSFPYWARALHERDLLAPSARLLGLTNPLHDSLLHNTGLVAAAKAALQMYVRYLAMELGPFGHRVNLLKFGTILTPAVRTVMGPEAIARQEEVHREMIPAGRIGNADEVARCVAYLARDESEWFNGATIDFTGGMTLRLLDLVLRPD